MPARRLMLLAVLGVAALAGCRMPWSDGPVSRPLAASRGLCQQGVAAMEQGEWKEAQRLLAQAVKVCPADVEARCHYAEVLWQQGERQKALLQLNECFALAGPAQASTSCWPRCGWR